jgi:hypothetical protein
MPSAVVLKQLLNVFAFGPYGTGKTAAVRQIITREAAIRPPASDWVMMGVETS